MTIVRCTSPFGPEADVGEPPSRRLVAVSRLAGLRTRVLHVAFWCRSSCLCDKRFRNDGMRCLGTPLGHARQWTPERRSARCRSSAAPWLRSAPVMQGSPRSGRRRRGIVAQFKLQGLEAQLTEAMTMAGEDMTPGISQIVASLPASGPTGNSTPSNARCADARAFSANEGLLNRLKLASVEMPPDAEAPVAEAEYIFGPGVFDAVAHAQRQVAGLLAMVKYARRIDGRRHNVLPRDDLRAAARAASRLLGQSGDAVRSATGAAEVPFSPRSTSYTAASKYLDGTAKLEPDR